MMLSFSECRMSVFTALAVGSGVFSLYLHSAESPPKAVTLEEAVRIALENNSAVHVSSARVRAAEGRAYQARQWTNPELELKAEEWPVSNGRGFSDAKQTIGVAQTLPFPGKKSLEKGIGGAGVNLSEAELAVRKTELVRDVKAAFFRVLATERLVEVAQELVRLAESSAAVARKRVDAGAAPYQEQLRAEVQLEEARTELGGFHRELAGSRDVFAILLGLPDFGNASLAGVLQERQNEQLLDAPPDELLKRHPSVIAAQTNLARSELEQKRARLEPYPDVRVALAGGRIGETDQSIIELGFSVPIPIIDRGKGKLQEAAANVSVAQAELTAVQHQLQREWTLAHKRYTTALDQVDNYRERLLPKAEEALRLLRTGFEEGKFGFIDLLDTQRTMAEARRVYQYKLLELNIAQAELEALLQPQTIPISTN